MERERIAEVSLVAGLGLAGALIAAYCVATLVVTLGSGDLGFGDVLLLALWLPALVMFSAGCFLRARRRLADGRAGRVRGEGS